MRKNSVQFYGALLVIFIIVAASILAPVLATHNPFEPNIAERLQGPSILHWFGTDALGRDMYSRILYGGRISMVLSLVGALVSSFLGLTVGLMAGFYGGKADLFITLMSNIIQGIPGSCFMIALISVLGPSIYSLILALVITSWAGFSRIVRAQVMELKEEAFIEGLRCFGASDFRIIVYHIIPNLIDKLLVLFTMRVGRGVLSVAGLSFLGLGVQPPAPDWSVMINDAMLYYRSAPHLIIIPGLFIFLLIYSLNVFGDALRDRLDVRFDEVRKW